MENFISRFSKILQDLKFVSEKEASDLRTSFKGRSKEAIIEFLLDEEGFERGQVLKALSIYYGMPAFDTTGFLFDHGLVSSFPVDFLRGNGVIPLSEENEILTVVASDPDISGLTERIEKYTDAVVEYNVGIKRDIWDAIQEFSQIAVTEESYEELDTEEEASDELPDTQDYY